MAPLLAGRVQGSLLESRDSFFVKNRRKGGRKERRLGKWRELSPPSKFFFDSAKKAAANLVAKSKAGPHAWLSFWLGNSKPPSVNNHSPSAPAYITTSDVVDPQYSANSEETDEEF